MLEINEDLHKIVCYPKFSKCEAKRRIKRLNELGIERIINFGAIKINNFRILGKGTNSIVVKAIYNGKEVAIKIRRTDSSRKTLLHEANILKKVNSESIGPILYKRSKDFLIMEYIEGFQIDNFIQASNFNEIKKVIIELLIQCRKLDKLGIDHGELSRPNKHVLITSDYKVKIIDFESASVKRNPKNLTSILSYLLYQNEIITKILKNNEHFLNIIRKILKNYKKHKKDEDFNKILSLIETVL